MPSTFTPLLRLTKPGLNDTGWGTTVNDGTFELIDNSLAGLVSVNVTSGNATLTTANGATDQARYMFVRAFGASVARDVIVPATSKLYFVINDCTAAVTFKASGQTGVSIPAGRTAVLRCDGTDVVAAVTHLTSLTLASALPVASGGTGITSFGTGVATWLGTPSSANLAAAVTDETGTGALVFATSPTLITPTLGVATATSVNKVAITAPATSATLTIANGKTLTANSSLTLTGTDATTMTFPTTSATLARTDAAQTFTGTQTFSSNPTLNGGTANGVAYLNASKVVTSGSALTFNGTNLATTGTATATKLIPTGNVTAGNGMYLPATNTLAWSTNGAEGMRLNASGGLSVGSTTDPGAGNIQLPAGGQLRFSSTTYITPEDNVSGARIVTPGILSIATGGTSIQATLDASGNLGIGTSSPNSGGLTVFKATGAAISVQNNFTGTGNTAGFHLIGGSGGDAYLWNYSNSFVAFGTNAQERMRITSGGDLCINRTASDGYRVSIDGDGTNNPFRAKIVSASASYAGVFWNDANSGDNAFVAFVTEPTGSAVTRGGISYNRAGGLVAYNTTSDYRAKDIIGPVANPGAAIDALKVYTGKMKGATVARPMLVAHEAQAVAPYSVTGEKDEVNEDGTPKYQQMDASALVPLLIAEIQSLRARVAALESN